MRQRKELGIAVIGSGRIGMLRATMAAAHPAVRFIAVSDRDPQRAKTLADKVGAQYHTGSNLEAMSRPVQAERFGTTPDARARRAFHTDHHSIPPRAFTNAIVMTARRRPHEVELEGIVFDLIGDPAAR